MKPAAILILMCVALAGVALAQQPAPAEEPAAPPPISEVSQPAPEETQTPRESQPEAQPFDERVQRLLDEFNKRHQQRELEMSSYGKASRTEPALERFADPRKVQVGLKDELDREQTSTALAKEYADQSREIQSAEQALQAFIAKRHQALDDLGKRATVINRQDLEVAAANLARQPGTEVQVRNIRRRLSEAERAETDAPAKQAQAQQEAASAEEELARLKTLHQSLEKESKAYTADSTSAHQNRLALADRLEFYVVRAQAEDVLDQGHKAAAAVRHISASPEVEDTLKNPAPHAKLEVKANPSKLCSPPGDDGKGCPEETLPGPKE
jgi:vancomycin resistance protein YoaR